MLSVRQDVECVGARSSRPQRDVDTRDSSMSEWWDVESGDDAS